MGLVQTGFGFLAGGQRSITLQFATLPVEGNLLIASVVWDSHADTIVLSPPPGWNRHGDFVYSGSRRVEVWSRLADASPTTDFLWQMSSTSDGIVTGGELSGVSDVASVVESSGVLDPPPLSGDIDLWVAGVGAVHFSPTPVNVDFVDMTFGDSAQTTGGTKLQSSWAWTTGPSLDTLVTGGNGLIVVGFAPPVDPPVDPPAEQLPAETSVEGVEG